MAPVDRHLVSVALPVPFQAPFTYRMGEGAGVPERGCRVQVPFGGRLMIGVVTGPADGAGGREIKEVGAVLDESPLVPPPLLDLAAWTADHYLAPPGDTDALAAGLVQAIEDARGDDVWGGRARDRALATWSGPEVVLQYLEVYSRALSS